MKPLAWGLWLLIALCLVGGFAWAPLAEGFIGQSSRILFAHVPMAWGAFAGFIAAGVWSVLYLVRRRREDDVKALAAVEIGLLYCFLATVTGALWAKVMWGAYWNWDPRQTSITVVLIFYAAYLVLRSAFDDPETRARLGAVYAVLGLVVAPFFFFVLPRLSAFTLHPEPVINATGKVEMNPRMLVVLLASGIGFTILFFWLHRLQVRLALLEEERAAEPFGAPGESPAVETGLP